jgi:transketolase
MVLSKGHGVMALYGCISELGWIDKSIFRNYFADGSELKGLADSHVKGLEVTSGSLGHGLSIGVGMAYGAKKNRTDQKTYIIVGDGELNEGAIWEGLLFAAHHKLNNLVVIVDNNDFQAMGAIEDILSMDSIQEKFKAFGFETMCVSGHDEADITNAISTLWRSDSDKPKAIVARTIKGKGVSFMEKNNEWHYRRLTSQEYDSATIEVLGI